MGDLRDGIGLLQWVKSFTNSSSVSAQAALTATVISMKLGSGANLDTFGLHCESLLQTWSSISGNDPERPGAFYYLLLHSIPDGNEGSKLHRLRVWLEDLMAEESDELADPVLFIAKFYSRAKKIGLPTSGQGQQVHVTKKKEEGEKSKVRRKATCKFCNVFR